MLKNLKQFNLPEIEERVLKFWKENNIFRQSSVLRQSSGKNFVFFEGPPTANGRPGMHHVLGRSFKDVILRYRAMRGYHVVRRAGWDTHGLPVEIEVEKELGIKRKSEIEKFGIAEFNARAKFSVWKYKTEWEKLTERVGFWLDFDTPYITYEPKYIETVWWILSQIDKRGLLKKLYKVVPYCLRCQTPLSSHELGQPGVYKKTKDPSVYVKFKIKRSRAAGSSGFGQKSKIKEYFLVWTTTPWTLPANVAIAINPKLTYTKYLITDNASKSESEYLWSYNPPPPIEGKKVEVAEKISGQKLIGTEYEPLFKLPKSYKFKTESYYRVMGADFVSIEDGSGLVHIAPAFGDDDFKLISRQEKDSELLNIPVTVDDEGLVKKGFPGSGKFIKDADKDIAADLKQRNLLYLAETIEHDYPFCWRCSQPLIYFARSSWFIEMSKLREELLNANQKINWIPDHVKEGRFGEWLREVKDWAISRDRYWGTPLPIWECVSKTKNCGKTLVIGSLKELNKYALTENQFFIMRHSEARHNIEDIIASGEKGKSVSTLTALGIEQAKKAAKALKKKKIDLIYCSPYARTVQTAKIVSKETGSKIIVDKRLAELNTGVFNGRAVSEYHKFFGEPLERFTKAPPGGESLNDVKKRMAGFFQELNNRHNNKRILVIGHGDPLWVLEGALRGFSNEEILKFPDPKPGEWRQIEFNNWPYNNFGEIDLHRPFVDEIHLKCPNCETGKMARVKGVADVWFDSGAMPFAQWHYPFENKKLIDTKLQFPSDYIAEGMDQTRGWFYTLLAVSVLLSKGVPFRNVISLGLLLDKHGQKMSKSKGNTVDPWQITQKYGADAVRWYFYTINAPGESKKFDEEDLARVLRRFIFLIYNSFVFWNTYADKNSTNPKAAELQAIDKWILSRLNVTIAAVTLLLDQYEIGEAGRKVEQLIDDLSRWYIRRSRRRFQDVAKGGKSRPQDWQAASATLYVVLSAIAKMLAPFTPFFSEALYSSTREKGEKLSVHLADWPETEDQLIDKNLLNEMEEVRRLVELALGEREKYKIKIRQPLSRLKVKNSKLKDKNDLLELLKEEINVKDVIFDSDLTGEVELDIAITPELRNEGIMRELARMTQGLRHDAGYNLGDKIFLMIEAPKELASIIEKNLPKLKKEVNAKNVELKKSDKFDAEIDAKLEDWQIWLAVRKG